MPLELAIHCILSFQKRRRAINGLPFQSPFSFDSPTPLSCPLSHPTLPDSFLIESDIQRKCLQDGTVASRRVPTALETISADFTMQREISLRRRADRGTLLPPKPNIPGVDRMTGPVAGGRNLACLPERIATANSVNARTTQSCGSFGESSSTSSQVRDGKIAFSSAFCL